MELINKYIYTATKRLPTRIKADVEKKLRAEIDDMLPENYTEDDVINVLKTLGNPVKAAEKYNEHKRYLISPEMFGNYIYVLKLIIIIVVCIMPVVAFIATITPAASMAFADMFREVIKNIVAYTFNTILQVFLWVTVIFAIMDHVDKKYVQWPYTGKEWTVDDLETVQTKKGAKIDISDPISTIVFETIFTVIFCFYPQLIGWYEKDTAIWEATPLFNLEILRLYIPIIVILFVVSILTAVIKLIYRRWNWLLAIVNAIESILSLGFIFIFLGNYGIFNQDFKNLFIQSIEADPQQFNIIWQWGVIGLILIISVGYILSIANGFIKANKTLKDTIKQ